jgi:hypothetical protein
MQTHVILLFVGHACALLDVGFGQLDEWMPRGEPCLASGFACLPIRPIEATVEAEHFVLASRSVERT